MYKNEPYFLPTKAIIVLLILTVQVDLLQQMQSHEPLLHGHHPVAFRITIKNQWLAFRLSETVSRLLTTTTKFLVTNRLQSRRSLLPLLNPFGRKIRKWLVGHQSRLRFAVLGAWLKRRLNTG
jgi:hypothetical protein